MPDKLDAGPYWGNSNLPGPDEPRAITVFEKDWREVHRERDELRDLADKFRRAALAETVVADELRAELAEVKAREADEHKECEHDR